MPFPSNQDLAVDILDHAPLGLALIEEQRLIWLNRTLAELLQIPTETLLGRSQNDLPSHLRPLLDAHVQDLAWNLSNGGRCHLRRRVVSLAKVEAHFFTDVTSLITAEKECERLQALVRMLETRDGETGLKNRNAILHALDSQLSRSRRYGNPLSVIRLTLTPPKAASQPHLTLREISQEFNGQLRWADEIGRLDETDFLLILPETTLSAAETLARQLAHERIALASRAQGWDIRFAVAAWHPGDDAHKLLERLGPLTA